MLLKIINTIDSSDAKDAIIKDLKDRIREQQNMVNNMWGKMHNLYEIRLEDLSPYQQQRLKNILCKKRYPSIHKQYILTHIYHFPTLKDDVLYMFEPIIEEGKHCINLYKRIFAALREGEWDTFILGEKTKENYTYNECYNYELYLHP